MTQLVFIHGPGAGGCADAWINQLKYFSGSLAPTLPENVSSLDCPDVTDYKEWFEFQRHAMMWVEQELRERLMENHRRVGPMSQYRLLDALHRFDVRDRLHTLRPKLLLIRGANDPGNHPETEQDIQEKVPGAELVRVSNAGHFPATERPDEVNPLIKRFVESLSNV